MPGRIDDPGAVGCLRLLRQGAGLVADAQDVFDALGWLRLEPEREGGAEVGAEVGTEVGAEGPAAGGEPTRDGRLLGELARGPRSPDELAMGLEMPVTKVLSRLGRLEIEGWVERRPGGNYAAVRRSSRR